MKFFLFFIILFFTFSSFAQSVSADPALSPMKFTTISNGFILPTDLPLNENVILKVPILNNSTTNSLPYGSCKVKIGLGTKLLLSPDQNLSGINTSNYFYWTASVFQGQVQITGELINELPPNYSDTAMFLVKGSILGLSTVTSNFLVTNHVTAINLSDDNGANNIASQQYRIANISLPLNLLSFNASINNCKTNLKWVTTNEVNTSHFEIEKSENANQWKKIGIKLAQGNSSNQIIYNYVDSTFLTQKTFYRLKIIDVDNSFQYSSTVAIISSCNSLSLHIFSNPLVNGILTFKINGFSKNCIANLQKPNGQTVLINKAFNGVNSINIGLLSKGLYILTVYDNNGNTKQNRVIIQN